MFLRLAAACLIFLWTAGSAAEAEECHGNSRALSTSFPVANAEEWAATIEAPVVPGRFAVLYAVSDNPKRHHDLENPFGWQPVR